MGWGGGGGGWGVGGGGGGHFADLICLDFSMDSIAWLPGGCLWCSIARASKWHRHREQT